MGDMKTILMLTILKTSIELMPDEDRAEVERCAATLRSLVNSPNEMIAFALVGCELQNKENPFG